MAEWVDCIELKRRGAERVQAILAEMTPEEQLAWWRQRHAELVDRQRLARERLAAEQAAEASRAG